MVRFSVGIVVMTYIVFRCLRRELPVVRIVPSSVVVVFRNTENLCPFFRADFGDVRAALLVPPDIRYHKNTGQEEKNESNDG